MNPSSVVFASVVIITGSTAIRRIRENKLNMHVTELIVFGFLLLIALLILAIVMPEIAKILAYLGIVGAFAVNGPAVFDLLGDFGRGKALP